MKERLPLKIAKATGHDPVNIDRYIDDFNRIQLLYEDGNCPYKICFYTSLGRKFIREYINFIKEYNISYKGIEMLNVKFSKP